MKIKNLTPHALNLILGDEVITIESSGIARAAQFSEKIGTVEVNGMEIPVNHTKYGEVENLPEPVEGVVYVVSALTAQAVPERADVLIVADTVRDEKGRIIGCKALAHI